MSHGGRVAWAAPVLFWLLAIAVYWGAQGNQRLTEDSATVWGNPAVAGEDLRGALLGRYEYNQDATSDMVRPVATLVNRFREAAFGEDRAPYVWTQVTLHAICASLLAFLVLATLGSIPAAVITGVLFVVHPLLTSSVLGLAGIAEQLSLAFGLGGLLVLGFTLREPWKRGRAGAIAGLLFLFSVGSKEAGFLLLPAILFWILSANPPVTRSGDAWRIRYLIGFLGAGVLGLAFRLVSLGAVSAGAPAIPAVHPDTGLVFLDRTVIGLASIWTYLWLLIYPRSLSYTYDFLPDRFESLGALSIAGAILIFLLLLVLVLLTIRRKTSGSLWVGFLIFSLLGGLGFLAPIGDFLNERTAYFVLPAFLGAGAWVITSTPKINTSRWFNVSICVALIGVSSIFGLRTVTRVDDYIHQDTLIRASIINHGSAQAHYDLGNLFLSRGQYSSAREQYEAALEKNPELWMAWVNIGAAFSREEDFSLAMRAYSKALEGAGERPEYRVPMAKAHFNRALILMRQNRNSEALEDLLATVEVLPDHLRAHASLAFIFRNSERFDDQALEHFRRAIELEADPQARKGLEEARDYIHERRERLDRGDELRINAGESTDPDDGPLDR